MATLLASLLAARSSAAQQAADAAPPVEGTVETRAAAVEDPRFASGFVTRAPLQNLSAPTEGLIGPLESVPGLSVRRQSSYGQPAYLQIRGGNPRQLVVLLNGVRIRVPTGLGFDVGRLATTGIDSLTVYRGPAGVVHGGGALTGALELTVHPRRRHGSELSASLLGGSFGTGEAAARGDLALAQGGSARLAVNARHADGDFEFLDAQGRTQRRLNNDHDHLQALAAGAWYDDTGRVGVTLLAEKSEAGVAGPSEFQQLFGAARLEEQRVVAASDGTRRDLFRGEGYSIDLSRYFGLQWRGVSYTNPEAVLGQGGFDSTSSATNSEAGFALLLATKRLFFAELSAGVRTEIFFSEVERQSLRERLDTRRRTLYAALGSERVMLDRRLHLTAAGRAEIITEPNQFHAPWMGAVGLIFKPDKLEGLSVMGNLARTYRLPDFDELYLKTEFVRGDEALRPERGVLADLGARYRPERLEALTLELVTFTQRVRDQIAFVPVSAYLIQARNFDRVRAQGVEGGATLALLEERLDLELTYTFTDAWRPDTADRAILPNQPRHRAQALTQLRLGELPGLGLTRLSTRVSRRSDLALDAFASQVNPGWTRWDAGVSARPLRWIDLRFDVTNLLDHRRAVDTLQRPLPGRAAYLSVEFTRRRDEDDRDTP